MDLSIISRQEVGNGSRVEMDMNYVRCVDFWQSFGSPKTKFWESIVCSSWIFEHMTFITRQKILVTSQYQIPTEDLDLYLEIINSKI